MKVLHSLFLFLPRSQTFITWKCIISLKTWIVFNWGNLLIGNHKNQFKMSLSLMFVNHDSFYLSTSTFQTQSHCYNSTEVRNQFIGWRVYRVYKVLYIVVHHWHTLQYNSQQLLVVTHALTVQCTMYSVGVCWLVVGMIQSMMVVSTPALVSAPVFCRQAEQRPVGIQQLISKT